MGIGTVVSHSAAASARIRSCKYGLEATVSQHLDCTSEQFLEILLEGDQVQQRAPRLDLDEQVDVAIRPRITSGHRTKHADIARAVARRQFKDLLSVRLQIVDRHSFMIATTRRSGGWRLGREALEAEDPWVSTGVERMLDGDGGSIGDAGSYLGRRRGWDPRPRRLVYSHQQFVAIVTQSCT
jgi:hypothetical protein